MQIDAKTKTEIDLIKPDYEGIANRLIGYLVSFYSEKTHFVYELLQNAEDAKATKVVFRQYSDRLELLHNGNPFTASNLSCLLNAALSDKTNDENAKGQFGIGFKSVFTFCKEVELYSEPKNKLSKDSLSRFAIKIINYIEKEFIEEEWSIESEFTTRFVFPYCAKDKFYTTTFDIFTDIKKKLTELGSRVLLFMENIEEIHYILCDTNECKSRICKLHREKWGNNINYISMDGSSEQYLVFSNQVEKRHERIDIAFVVNKVEGNISFHKSNDSKISVYFPTDTDSKLNFIIQGNYKLTENRSQIKYDSIENEFLFNLTAKLLRNAILDLRDRGLLTLDLLALLPLRNDSGIEFLNCFPQVIKELLSKEKVIPRKSGGYTLASNSKIADGDWLADISLFSDEMLSFLLRKEAYFLPTIITKKAYDDLFEYFKTDLEIEVLPPEKFATRIKENPTFLSYMSNEWLVRFYEQIATQVPKTLQKKGSFSHCPFIKTSTGKFVEPYNQKWDRQVYLRPEGSILELKDFLFISDEIKNQCKELISVLELTEPKEYDYFIKKLEIASTKFNGDEKENLNDVKLAIKFLSDTDEYPCIYETVKKHLLLRCIPYAKNISVSSLYTVADSHIFWRKTDDGLSVSNYYNSINKRLFILDDKYYKENGIKEIGMLYSKRIVEPFELYDENSEYGICDIDLIVKQISKNIQGINIADETSEKRIKYIEKICFEKSRIILKLLNKRSSVLFCRAKAIEGKHALYTHIRNPIREKLTNLLVSMTWLKTESGEWKKPSEISREDLHEDYGIRINPDSEMHMALQFGKTKGEIEKENEINEKLRQEKEKREEAERQAELERQKAYEIDRLKFEEREVENKKNEIDSIILSIQSHPELLKEILNRLDINMIEQKSEEDDFFDPTNDDEYNKLLDKKIDDLKRLREVTEKRYFAAGKVEYERIVRSVRVSRGKDKEYIGSYYNGYCQMCKKPSRFWEVAEIFEQPEKEIEQMNLSFCPSCAGEYRHLRRISGVMQRFSENIRNANLDGNLLIRIGDSKYIRFTQTHLAEIQIILDLEKQHKNDID